MNAQQLTPILGTPLGKLPRNARSALATVRLCCGKFSTDTQIGYDIGLARVRGGFVAFKWGWNYTAEQVKSDPTRKYVYIGNVNQWTDGKKGDSRMNFESRMNFAPIVD